MGSVASDAMDRPIKPEVATLHGELLRRLHRARFGQENFGTFDLEAPWRHADRPASAWLSTAVVCAVRRWPIKLLLVVAICLSSSAVRAAEDERNWFEDPFFQVSSAVASCPTPSGPFVTEREKQAQSHRRAEKGTTCWLAGRCERPSSYHYDRDIAVALQAMLNRSSAIADTSLWVTVQGRVVYLEGCAQRASNVSDIEALMRSAPYVEQVISIVRVGTSAAMPYRVRTRE